MFAPTLDHGTPAGTTLEFRFYPYTSHATGAWVVIDNLTVSGTVIPEPSSVLLLGIGAIAVGALRRRLRR